MDAVSVDEACNISPSSTPAFPSPKTCRFFSRENLIKDSRAKGSGSFKALNFSLHEQIKSWLKSRRLLRFALEAMTRKCTGRRMAPGRVDLKVCALQLSAAQRGAKCCIYSRLRCSFFVNLSIYFISQHKKMLSAVLKKIK